VPPARNALGGREPTAAAMRPLYPFRMVPLRIERFAYDVTPALCQNGEPPVLDAGGLVQQPVVIGFARMPNLSLTELRLNRATAALLERCGGGAAAGQLTAELAAELHPAGDASAGAEQALAALAGLYARGIVGFAEAPTPAAALCGGPAYDQPVSCD
jgi:hypothetical protein